MMSFLTQEGTREGSTISTKAIPELSNRPKPTLELLIPSTIYSKDSSMWPSSPASVTVTARLSDADNALMLNRQSDLDFGFLGFTPSL